MYPMQNIDSIRPLHNFLSLFRYPKSPDLACIIPLPIIPPLGVSHIIRYPRKFEHILCTECTPVRQQWAGFCAIMLLGDRITDRYDLARFQRGSEILSRTRMNGPIFFSSPATARNPRETTEFPRPRNYAR